MTIGKKIIGLSQISLLIGNTTQSGQPWNYIHKTTKMDSVSCIYVFVHTCTYICTCVCNKNNQRKSGYQLKNGERVLGVLEE